MQKRMSQLYSYLWQSLILNFLIVGDAFAQTAVQPAMPSVQGGQTEQLPNPIRGLIAYQGWYLPDWVKWLGGLLILLLTAFWFWRKRKNSDKGESIPIVSQITLIEEALSQLAPADPFIGKAQEDYFFQLSSLLRRMIEEVSDIAATDMTLKELKTPLQAKLPLGRSSCAELYKFLQRADMIKFAQAESSLEEAGDSLLQVRGWMSSLKPKLEEGQVTAMQSTEQSTVAATTVDGGASSL